jgi:threonine dehydrogenase-like Zn-dependent dehydrogenase
MRALLFNPTIPRFAAAKLAGRLSRRVLWSRVSPLQYVQTADPPLPGDDWVRVATRLGGICGSDLSMLHLETSMVASAYTSFPFIPGHESMGTIAEVGSAVTGLPVGQRVTVEPILPCATRGIDPPCANCATGAYNLCLRFADGRLSAGLFIGYCRDTGGSWGENFVAHRSRVLPLPARVTDGNALLTEPMAVAVHPLLRHRPAAGSTVLVIGGGVMGQCTVAAVRALEIPARVIALVKYPFQAEMARRLGADAAIQLGRGDTHYDAIADLTGGVLRRPMFGKRVLTGGADLTIECVGYSRSIDDALRLTRPGGTVVILGLASVPRAVDWGPVWLTELNITGSHVYATEVWQGRRQRTMAIVLDWLAEGRVDLSPLVTHLYPLEAYPQAFSTAMAKAETAAFKVAFQFP